MARTIGIGIQEDEEKTLNDTVQAALEQIREKQYAAGLMGRGITERTDPQLWIRLSGEESADRIFGDCRCLKVRSEISGEQHEKT